MPNKNARRKVVPTEILKDEPRKEKNVMLSEYERMSWETRIGRIAELCSKAVTLYVLKQSATGGLNTNATVSPSPNASSRPTTSPSMPDDAKAILVYLRRVHSASPNDICRYTELSHSTVTRRLRELVQQSIVVKTGKTRAVQYSVCTPQPNSDAHPNATCA